MRLVCLECSAAYEAPDSLFGPQPREVRCNRCGYQWTVVASPSEDKAPPTGPSIGTAAAPASKPPQPAEAPRPRPVMARPIGPEPLAAPPPPMPLSPLQRSGRLADTLAGPASASASGSLAANEAMRPVLVVEPAALSTRSLLSGVSSDEDRLAPPDLEERRLSHELDFDEPDRQRRSNGGGGTRRAVVILIMLIVLAGIVAIIFETQIVAAVPALKPAYAQLGL